MFIKKKIVWFNWFIWSPCPADKHIQALLNQQNRPTGFSALCPNYALYMHRNKCWILTMYITLGANMIIWCQTSTTAKSCYNQLWISTLVWLEVVFYWRYATTGSNNGMTLWNKYITMYDTHQYWWPSPACLRSEPRSWCRLSWVLLWFLGLPLAVGLLSQWLPATASSVCVKEMKNRAEALQIKMVTSPQSWIEQY